MDNITHTLVGAALAEAGLKKRTALGAATLMIGANFPDIDVAGLLFPDSIDFRRGITHGFPALVVLPFVLAGLMWLYDRRVRLRRNPTAIPADLRQLAVLSAIAIWSHPTLDFMNIYGMRWLMPFVNRWYYADALFIVDLWILLALGIAVAWSRRRRTTRPPRVALAGLAAYIVAMLGITSAGRAQVDSSAPFMVGPTPLVPWQREVIARSGAAGLGYYKVGKWSPGGPVAWTDSISLGDGDPAVALARAAPEAQGFLNWSRFPFYRVERGPDGTLVRIADARYAGETGRGWASVVVRLP
ncbi:MAG TPA: metal-dependent hydrolase [Gemmatimonadaceae bacterium]|nr:metal-dependent hydrolase [Gemmatimonadaceae bacterium]